MNTRTTTTRRPVAVMQIAREIPTLHAHFPASAAEVLDVRFPNSLESEFLDQPANMYEVDPHVSGQLFQFRVHNTFKVATVHVITDS